VPAPRQAGAVPLRPLTLGELLDAAVGLLRRNALVLLSGGLLLAVAEQVVLHPLRAAASVTAPGYLPHSDRLGTYWVLIAAGLGTEAAAIALLGGLAAGAAGSDLLGARLPARRLLARAGSRLPGLVTVAAASAVMVTVSALAGLVPWLFGYGLTGLAAPAVVIDRNGPGGALLRSVLLSARIGMRAMWVRVAGYLAWLAVRAVLGLGAPLVLYLSTGDTWWLPWAAAGLAAAVNAVAYPALGCLDAVLHLETRMRTEGLDIWLGRALRAGVVPDHLAALTPDLAAVPPDRNGSAIRRGTA
jgi:hypothetical protein